MLEACPTSQVPILTVSHVTLSVFPPSAQVNSTDGDAPLQVVHTALCPEAPHAVDEPQAGTVIPNPLSWVHWGELNADIDSVSSAFENAKNASAITKALVMIILAFETAVWRFT